MKKINKDKIKTWFVTGASSGVGHEICTQLLERGYNIIAVARRIPNFKHDNALCLSVDVTKPATIKNAIQNSIERFGSIDVLSNNAGVSSGITAEEETLEHMKDVMDVNFFGTFNTINALLPHFRNNHNGTIINNSSMSGISIRYGGSAYCASKHAIEALSGVCKHECQKFCRVMTFELGWYKNTEIASKSTCLTSKYDEYYKLIPEYGKHIYLTFENDLSSAVQIIIDKAEQQNLPRRLILGRDAYLKAKYEQQLFKKNIADSKKYVNKISKYKFYLILDLLKKIFNKYVMKNITNRDLSK